jgi:hypothetical protein
MLLNHDGVGKDAFALGLHPADVFGVLVEEGQAKKIQIISISYSFLKTFTTRHFLHKISWRYITLGWKGLPWTTNLPYLANS